jgi:protein transport protein SEC61 subunit gamma and related proteins
MNKILTSMNTFFIQCKRVWVVLKKPTMKEFETISKVSAIGILVIGLLGFLVSMVVVPFFRG